MTFNVSSFKNAIGLGVRPNLYKVTVTSTDLKVAETDAASLLVKSAALPGSTVGTIEVPHIGGRRLKLAGDRTYADWTMTVIADGSYATRKIYEDFHNLFVSNDFQSDSVGTRGTGLATVTIQQFDVDGGSMIRKYVLQNCFITSISTIDLSYDSADSIEEFTVTWSYDYFTASAT